MSAGRHASMLDYITARSEARYAWDAEWSDDPGAGDALAGHGVDVETYLDWATEAEAEGSPSDPFSFDAWHTLGGWDWDAAAAWYEGRHVA